MKAIGGEERELGHQLGRGAKGHQGALGHGEIPGGSAGGPTTTNMKLQVLHPRVRQGQGQGGAQAVAYAGELGGGERLTDQIIEGQAELGSPGQGAATGAEHEAEPVEGGRGVSGLRRAGVRRGARARLGRAAR